MIQNIPAWENNFNTQYKKVFNDDNTVKACGRNECKKLISIASENTTYDNYGNPDTGYMNVNNLIGLHNNIDVKA